VNESDNDSHHYDTNRLEMFSDGVFAIAITLLVLEIAVPHIEGDASLARALWHEWPSFLGFTLSFITIGLMWMNHHSMFKDIDRTDHRLLVINTLLMLCISFTPYPTAILAEHFQHPEQRLTATLFYGACITVTAIFFVGLWLYASVGRRLIDHHVSEVRVRSRTRRYLPGPAIYALGLPLAFVTPWASLGLWIALSILYLLPLYEGSAADALIMASGPPE
jgi:uncharacterized membrane protein